MKIKKTHPIEGSQILELQAARWTRIRSGDPLSFLTVNMDDPVINSFREMTQDGVNPLLELTKIRPGDLPDPDVFNLFYEQTLADIGTILNLSFNSRNLMLFLHNVIALKEASIIGKLKTLRGKIATLRLYARDLGSRNQYRQYSFLSSEELLISEGENQPALYLEEEGALLLPPGTEEARKVPVGIISFGEESDGSAGAQYPTSSRDRSDPQFLIDNSEFTWFEYEKVQDAGEPDGAVRLVLNLKLASPSIVNRIRIDPVNLGTTNWVKIVDIRASRDGISRPVSIAGDIGGARWEDDDVFSLSPSVSKYAGTGVYTIRPRRVQTIQIILEQTTPIEMMTSNGPKNRYAIAIRNIILERVSFADKADFALASAVFETPLRALGLTHHVSPYDEDLGEIIYNVSTDGGENWVEMKALDNKDPNFVEALVLETPSSRVQIRGTIKRNSEAFRDYDPTSAKEIKIIEKIIPFPGSNAGIRLEHNPHSFVEVLKTGLYTVGNLIEPTLIGVGKETPGNRAVYRLPAPIPPEELRVIVGGEEWEIVDTFTDITSSAVRYVPAGLNPHLVFGDGSEAAGGLGGRPVDIGAEIFIYRIPEHPHVSQNATTGRYEIHLSTTSGKSVENTLLAWKPDGSDLRTNTIVVPTGHRSIELPDEHIIGNPESDSNFWNNTISVGVTEGQTYSFIAFVDGREEFADPGENGYKFSYDGIEHTFHLSLPSPHSVKDVEIAYQFSREILFTSSDLKYSSAGNIVEIVDQRFAPTIYNYNISDLIALSPLNAYTRILHIPYKMVESTGSLQITSNGAAEPVIKFDPVNGYIPFQDGSSEFENVDAPELRYTIDFDGELSSIKGVGSNIVIHADNETQWTAANFLGEDVEIRFLGADVEAHFQAGKQLVRDIDWHLEDATIVLSPDQILELDRSIPSIAHRLLIRYDTTLEDDISNLELSSYYSPVLRELVIVGATIDPRLASLGAL